MMKFLRNILKTVILTAFLALGSVASHAQILGWNANSNGGGFGVSPWTPVTQDANVTTSGLVRGSSIGTGGSAAGGCWGGANGWSTGSGATTDNSSFHFTVVAATGYKISLSGITTATRRSNSGPTGYTLYYSVDGGPFTIAGAATTSSTSGTTGTPNSIPLSGIAALQNVPAGTVIKFRINPSGTSGNYYLTGGTNSLKVNGTVEMDQINAPVATDATGVAAAGFMANWDEVTGATGYRLDVATDADFTNILENYDNFAVAGTSHFVDMGILPNTTYYYRVRAEQGVQVSGNSNVIEVTTLCDIVAMPVAAAQSFCGSATVAELSVTTGEAPLWYEAETGGTALTDETTLTTGTYYVSQTVNGCESERTAVEVTVNEIPVAPTAGSLVFCGTATVAELSVTTGEAPLWYEAETGGTALTGETTVTTGTYYVSQTVNGCESLRTAVEVTVNEIPVAPTADAQLLCGESTVAQLTATSGESLQWYSAETGGTALTDETAVATGTYYVSQTVNGCESSRTAVAVTVNAVPALPTVTPLTFCGSATAAQLTATVEGGAIWYADDTTATPLAIDAELATGTYYVSQIVNGCESARAAVEVTVNEIPVAPAADAQLLCGESTVAQLTATSGESLQWYSAETGGTALTDETAVATGTYYVSQTVNGCESSRTAVAVTVNAVPALPTVTPLTFCGSATAAQLTATVEGGAIWYADSTTATPLAIDAELATGTYYVSQIVNGCESARAAVEVTVNEIPVAPAADAQLLCGESTVAQLTATSGESLQWYSAETGGTVLTDETAVTTGTYYVSQTVNGCESLRTAVAVTVNAVPALPTVTPLSFCGSATAAQLTATVEGAAIWYADSTTATPLAIDAELATGTYYVSQIVNGCESARAAVEVTVNEIPVAPTANAQLLCGESTVAQLTATSGESLQWYSAETGGEALSEDTALATGTYYVSQTINGCESTRTAVEVGITVVDMPEGETAQEFTVGETLASLEVTGVGMVWYADAELTQELPANTILTDNTTYYVVSVDGDCISEALTITVDEVLSTGSFTKDSFSYYPNPVTDVLNIKYAEAISSVEVYNLLGQPVLNLRPQAGSVQVNMSALAKGAYVVIVRSGSHSKSFRVIKN